MKVLHVIPSVSPLRGGPSRAVIGLVRALNEAGIEAEIATTNDDGPQTLSVLLGQRIDREGAPALFFRRFSPPVSMFREYAISFSFTRWLWEHAADYDLIHVHAIFSFPSTVAMVIARLKKIPYIVRPLGQLCPWPLSQSRIRKKIYLSLLERANLKHAAAIHFTSALEAEDSLKELLPDVQFIIPHGIEPISPVPDASVRLRERLKVSRDTTLILFMSRVHPKKGLDVLIPALATFQEKDFRLVLAGNSDPGYEAKVALLIERSGMGHKVIRIPYLKGEEKELFLQGADLFALTSYSENFGIVVLEALAAGTPVLVSKQVALADFVQKIQAGYITDVTVESVTLALKSFFSKNYDACQGRERIVRITRDEFSWKNIARDLADKYLKILEGVNHGS
jgi:glycosyltransferase involved in cell wall biosynthesis